MNASEFQGLADSELETAETIGLMESIAISLEERLAYQTNSIFVLHLEHQIKLICYKSKSSNCNKYKKWNDYLELCLCVFSIIQIYLFSFLYLCSTLYKNDEKKTD